MSERVLYLLGVVAVGWLVTFGLRALPFLLFAGRDRALPPWVERLGNVISPIIIAGLIIYSYSGLEWRTAWPYVAGALTVGLQLWRRNPLLSIVTGTVLYMCLLSCGCTTAREVSLDAKEPSVCVTTQGVTLDARLVSPQDVVEALKDADIPKTRVVHIRLDPAVRDLRLARTLMGYLCKAGYSRPVLVTARHSESLNVGKQKPPPVQSSPRVRTIRKGRKTK